jgi:hypothetical protein
MIDIELNFYLPTLRFEEVLFILDENWAAACGQRERK